jgi:hypothetical protein
MQPQNRRIPIVRAESSRRLSSTPGAAPWRRCSRRWGTRRERAGRAPLGRHDAPPDELGGARRRAACLIGGLATIPSRNLQSQIASLGPVASPWPRPACLALGLAPDQAGWARRPPRTARGDNPNCADLVEGSRCRPPLSIRMLTLYAHASGRSVPIGARASWRASSSGADAARRESSACSGRLQPAKSCDLHQIHGGLFQI